MNHARMHRGVNLAYWLSQRRFSTAPKLDPETFITKRDFGRLVELGVDFIRLPVDEDVLWNADSTEARKDRRRLLSALDFAGEAGLKVIVDLHTVRGNDCTSGSQGLYADPLLQGNFLSRCSDLARWTHDLPDDFLILEPLNEPTTLLDHEWDDLFDRASSAIREVSPSRILVKGPTEYQHSRRFPGMRIPDDPDLVLSFHFYEPFLLTHYRIGWHRLVADCPLGVSYPGLMLDEEVVRSLSPNQRKKFGPWIDTPWDIVALDRLIAPCADRAKQVNLPLICGEFGCMAACPPASRRRWYKDLLATLDRHGIAACLWNYKSSGKFGLVDDQGEPDPMLLDVFASGVLDADAV